MKVLSCRTVGQSGICMVLNKTLDHYLASVDV